MSFLNIGRKETNFGKALRSRTRSHKYFKNFTGVEMAEHNFIIDLIGRFSNFGQLLGFYNF